MGGGEGGGEILSEGESEPTDIFGHFSYLTENVSIFLCHVLL